LEFQCVQFLQIKMCKISPIKMCTISPMCTISQIKMCTISSKINYHYPAFILYLIIFPPK
jgi:hypothetical protein